ncbi:DUF4249 domain-containing protein [Cellulophaga sp. Hel_I_12]|uniref:DUF4249 domain-containing protein n=1 Tax=Cellulophaga sp. Hel_I_12 TaxID=1249972 RepID=UPI0018CCEA9F|nr:DUF4249 domain-containing protein [Cellulophaga sp. Hel_I_12]
MKMNKMRHAYNSLILVFFLFGCTEVIVIETQDFEDIVVISANITSETKQQEINISRTYKVGFQDIKESGARVMVTDDLGANFEFSESTPGTYISDIVFAAQLDRNYKLTITTTDGNSYSSESVSPINTAFLEDVRVEAVTDNNGEEGIAIKVDSFDPEEKARYFRYEYEETYLIQSLFNNSKDLIIVSENPPTFETVPKSKEENICYNTVFSNEILIASSDQTTDGRVTNFQLNFIPRDDLKIRRRYSILVHQFVQSREANAFYKSLLDFSSNENLFIQTQPGFISGNIKSENTKAKVLGFFEVSMLSSKRIFFNFRDVFPEGLSSRYTLGCGIEEFDSSRYDVLLSRLQGGRVKFLSFEQDTGTYKVARDLCVDCTLHGTNIKPDFWID